MSAELAFELGNSTNFGYNDLYGLELYTAVSDPETVKQYFLERDATAFGDETVFPRVNNVGAKAESLSAYVLAGSFYIVRTIGDETTVYNYSAGASILLNEAWTLWQRHKSVCRLDLLAE